MIYGLKVILVCPNCGEVCPLDDPFRNFAQDIPECIHEGIREAFFRHRVTGCAPLSLTPPSAGERLDPSG